MSNYSEADLPVKLEHGEIVTLEDGTTFRYEANGEAKNIMLNDDFSPAETLFPGNEFTFQAGGKTYKASCEFGDCLTLEKV